MLIRKGLAFMRNCFFQAFVKQVLNVGIAITTGLLIFGLIATTRLLFDHQMSLEYDRLYFSVMLPVELLSILLVILIITKDLNFNQTASRGAISLLLLNCYSLFVISHYFPLFILDGGGYSAYYSLAYQILISFSGYISSIYGCSYIGHIFMKS